MRISSIAVLILYAMGFVAESHDRPTIGVLATPGEENGGWNSDPAFMQHLTGKSVIVGSYVKYLESAGLRVVPIHYAWPHTKIRDIFGKVNGILFTGGVAHFQEPDGSMSPYYQATRLLLDLVLEANDKGIYTPLWGICLGLEFLHNLVGRADVLGAHTARWV
jgi:gamma-glutamyl hydrolase